MKIITKIGGRYKGCLKTEKLFRLYESRIKHTLPIAVKHFRIKPPKELFLRPFYYKNGFCEFYGRMLYDPLVGWSMLMNVDDCSRKRDYGLAIVDHELAHLVTVIKHGDWSHSKEWENILDMFLQAKDEDEGALS